MDIPNFYSQATGAAWKVGESIFSFWREKLRCIIAVRCYARVLSCDTLFCVSRQLAFCYLFSRKDARARAALHALNRATFSAMYFPDGVVSEAGGFVDTARPAGSKLWASSCELPFAAFILLVGGCLTQLTGDKATNNIQTRACSPHATGSANLLPPGHLVA